MTSMISFILFVVISSFIINGWYECTRSGRIFSFWSNFWQHCTQKEEGDIPTFRFPEWVRNPTSECILCMASIYGTLIFSVTYYFEGTTIFFGYSWFEIVMVWISYLLCLTCSNYIVHKTLK
jgi:hypothetical protein